MFLMKKNCTRCWKAIQADMSLLRLLIARNADLIIYRERMHNRTLDSEDIY